MDTFLLCLLSFFAGAALVSSGTVSKRTIKTCIYELSGIGVQFRDQPAYREIRRLLAAMEAGKESPPEVPDWDTSA